MKSTGTETGGKAQPCLPNAKLGACFKGLWGTFWNAEVPAGQVSIAEHWDLSTYAKIWSGASAPIFLDSGPFTSERILVLNSGHVPVLWFIVGGRRQDFGSGCNWRSTFSLLRIL